MGSMRVSLASVPGPAGRTGRVPQKSVKVAVVAALWSTGGVRCVPEEIMTVALAVVLHPNQEQSMEVAVAAVLFQARHEVPKETC